MKNNYFVLIIIFLLAGQSELNAQSNKYLNPNLSYGSVIDIDGNTYATIQIGNQTWMAENLKTSKYNDGTPIQIVTDSTAWASLTTGAWSYYDNNTFYNDIYGKLYNWHAVNTGKLCPQGWHISSDVEWLQLTIYLGANTVAGDKMKSTGTITKSTGLWEDSEYTIATNESGFTGLPSGCRHGHGVFSKVSSFGGIGTQGKWWTSTEQDTYRALYRSLSAFNNFVLGGEAYKQGLSKGSGLSCRCVKD
ncbi:MAG: fibrobacter succinogenes major paralogous domain-containing protein [Chitinophagales bacterium]|nr:fibrobacter succinogenes major paralogous domain-containing protein [Chitinophagales bacterium]